jgi:acyl-CoA thioesterase YciA
MTDQASPRTLDAPTEPTGELCIRTLAMPADTNQNGDIFGGWLLSQMDVAGGIRAAKAARSRTVTVSIEAMTFRKPVYVGDVVSVYCSVARIGRTSVTIRVEAWVSRRNESAEILVTDGNFIYVAIDDDGRPQPIVKT